MKRPLPAYLSFRNINVPLLVFLVLFLNVKLVVKVLALLFIVLYDRDLRLGLSARHSRLPLFYFLIPAIEVIKYFLLTRNFGLNYFFIFCMGIFQWVLCLLAIHHLKLNVDRDPPERTHNTIRAFFLLNALASLFFLILLIVHPIWLTYWGQGSDISILHPSAGDAILGISFDSSTVNATINCLGLIYFLYKRDWLFIILCGSVIVLCTSNTTFFFTEMVLVLMVATVRSKKLRLRSIAIVVLLGALYMVFSAKNREYIHNYFAQLYILNKDTTLAGAANDSVLMKDSSGREIRVPAPPPITASTYKVSKRNIKKALSNLLSVDEKGGIRERSSLIDSVEKGKIADSAIYPIISETTYKVKPGKLISFAQTYFYLKMSLRHLFFGAGVGNFSSKLAFRASATGVQGSYPQKYQYVAPEFKYNHLKTYQTYAAMDASRHSVLNFPFSVYNQVLGEYGLIGLLLFGVFYLGYFAIRFNRLSYGRYMMGAVLAFFFMDYWFELFSLVILFELFLLLNFKEGREG